MVERLAWFEFWYCMFLFFFHIKDVYFEVSVFVGVPTKFERRGLVNEKKLLYQCLPRLLFYVNRNGDKSFRAIISKHSFPEFLRSGGLISTSAYPIIARSSCVFVQGSPKTAGGNVKGVSGLKARQGAGAVEKQEQVTGKASPTLASPHGELATAAETVSTADGKAGDSDWPTDPDSPGFKKLQEQQLEQLRELQLQAQAWAAQADGGQGFDVDRSAGSGVGAAASEANVPVSEPSAPAATDSLSSDNAGSHVEEASKSSKNASPSEPGVGAEGSRYAGLHQGGSQGQARGNHHRSRSSESEITVGGISGYNPGYGDNDSDCGSRMLEPAGLEGSRMGASDRSLGENSPGPFSAHFGGGHGSRPDELDFNDGRRESEVGKYDSDSGTNYYESSIDGHGRSLERQGDSRRSMDDVRYDERFTSVGSPYTPTSADFRRHFQSGVSGDLDETVSQATMSDLAYSSSGDFRSNLNSSSR